MEPEQTNTENLFQNYLTLKEILETGLAGAAATADLREAKGFLIEVQNHFRGLKLRREDREELYNRLQEAFAAVNKKIEDERLDFELTAWSDYSELKEEVTRVTLLAAAPENSREAWDGLIGIQNRLRASKLLREPRDELYDLVQVAFTGIKTRREKEHRDYELESEQNYKRLKLLVDKGLSQAEESHEYKETREFLKKIQSEFKGIKLVHEQREELYARLQTAFDILGKRVDDFFRYKKKNWEVKMQFTLSRFSADIFELQQAVNKDQAYLDELEDHLGILRSAGKEQEALLGVEARISSTRRDMDRKRQQILKLELEKDELTKRLEEPEE